MSRLGSAIAAAASALLLTGAASGSGSTGQLAQAAATDAVAPLSFWERLDKDIAGDEAQVPAPNANTSCPDRPNMLAAADTLLTLAELRGKDLQTLKGRLASTYAKVKAAGRPSLTTTTTLTIRGALQPLIRLMGKSNVVQNLGPESDTEAELLLDLSLASRSAALNQTLIERLRHAQTQLESTSAHCD